MKTKHLFLLLLSLFTAILVSAQIKYSRVRIKIPPRGLIALQAIRIALDHGDLNNQDNSFTTSLSDKELAILQRNGISYQVLIPDEAAEFASTNKPSEFYRNSIANATNAPTILHSSLDNPCGSFSSDINTPSAFTPGSMGAYYTYAEIINKIDEMVANFPSLAYKIVLPSTTLQGRQLVVLKISDNASVDENEPEAFYTGLHHAREPMSMMNLFFFMQYLLENYSTNNELRDLVDNRELYFLPCVNPDGYVYNQSTNPMGGGGWRKNRRNNGGGAFGVDLNRNYNVDWGADNIGSSPNPLDDDYRGSGPFSENETQAIRNFGETRNFTLAIDHHATGNYLIRSYGVDPSPEHPPLSVVDNLFFTHASQQMSRYNCFLAGDGMATVGYNSNGNSRDWYIAGDIGGAGSKGKVYGYTAEIGNGSLGFWPSASNIIPICRDMVFQNLQMAYIAGSYFDIQDMDNLGLNSVSGNFNFSVRRNGLVDAPVTITVIPLDNISSVGPPVTISSLTNYFDVTNSNIAYNLDPLIANGGRVRFVYQISSGGIVLNDTITKFYNPVTLFSDDIEGSLSSNWALTGLWGASSNSAHSGARSLSESPSGNYGAGNNTSATYRNSLNLSDATAAYLTFLVRHEAQNCNDKLQVEITADRTVASPAYQPVCGELTVTENKGTLAGEPSYTGYRPSWTREVINLQSFLGNADVGLRFSFSSNGSLQDDGFYIDDIEIVKSASLTLGVEFVNIWCILEQDGVLVKWEAYTDNEHDYFEIDRSENGKGFQPIGTVRGNPPYSFKDLQPASGPNNYRVKAVDKNGMSVYSPVVTVNIRKQIQVKLFPNPVTGVANLEFDFPGPETVSLEITNALGQLTFKNKLQMKRGTNHVKISMESWQPQVYNLTIRDSKNELISMLRILKIR